ncbi:MAG: HyaD/HybD family hydrogenase maturation endopeptidase [Propionibacteriaceae bacterium]|nr:HyaD/HybD family hydrogenase maturation endopeptidase [Propionibacteriaceae bacterium]
MPRRSSEFEIDESLRDRFAVTVLGVGNPIMGDDGVGITLLERLRHEYGDPRVDFVDGGTGGLELIPVVQDARRLLIVDAVAGDTPGEVVQFDGDQIPRMMQAKLSPHQISLLDLFTTARMLGSEPEHIAVVGVVPQYVGLRVGLSGVVEAALLQATSKAGEILRTWLGEENLA